MARITHPEDCPHCGMRFTYLANHVEHCVMREDNHEATRRALDDGTGTIRMVGDYMADRRGGISYKTIFYTLGAWEAIAAHFGLQMHPREVTFNKKAAKSRFDRLIDEMGAEMDEQIAANRALRYDCKAFRM